MYLCFRGHLGILSEESYQYEYLKVFSPDSGTVPYYAEPETDIWPALIVVLRQLRYILGICKT